MCSIYCFLDGSFRFVRSATTSRRLSFRDRLMIYTLQNPRTSFMIRAADDCLVTVN